MPVKIDHTLTPKKLLPAIVRMFDLSAGKILSIERKWKAAQGTPVFTAKGSYTSRGWTEWTLGLRYGSALLQFGDPFPGTLLAGARGVQLADLALESWRSKAWVAVPPLAA